MSEPPDVMTAAEASQYLQVHIKTLYEWIKAGKLRVIKMGPRSTRILKQDVLRFLESRALEFRAGELSPEAVLNSAKERRVVEQGVDASRATRTRTMKQKVIK